VDQNGIVGASRIQRSLSYALKIVSIQVVLDRFVFAFFLNVRVTPFCPGVEIAGPSVDFEFDASAGLERVIFFHPRHDESASPRRPDMFKPVV
jgi:hypothetical protein